MPAARAETAPAKINLTLRVLGRRADGYHDIESLVVFAGVGDELTFTPGVELALTVAGPTADAAGDIADNLVLKAARTLAGRVEGLKVGSFALSKRLPVAAGLGGGSSDAAAALRLLAGANGIALGDPRLMQAARATGADVPVCLDPCPRLMRGIGDILSEPLDVPKLAAVLVNPGVAVPTRDVFRMLRLNPENSNIATGSPSPLGGEGREGGGALGTGMATRTTPTPNPSPTQVGPARLAQDNAEPGQARVPWGGEFTEFVAALAKGRNDLEEPAIELQPVIANVLAVLRKLPGCRLSRMSGSGATCFALFDSTHSAQAAARTLHVGYPDWWVRATVLGGERIANSE